MFPTLALIVLELVLTDIVYMHMNLELFQILSDYMVLAQFLILEIELSDHLFLLEIIKNYSDLLMQMRVELMFIMEVLLMNSLQKIMD